jgi:hypothetical protein
VRRLLFALPLFVGLSSAARAEVTITFYSHHLGTYGSDIAFLHAFIALDGTTKAEKKPVHANFGFTAAEVTPSILWKSVPGEMASMPRDYVAASRRLFRCRSATRNIARCCPWWRASGNIRSRPIISIRIIA